MADNYIKELEEKVAHYEQTMNRCPQCKKSLPNSEEDSTSRPSRQTRSSRSAQQPSAKVSSPILTSQPKTLASASTLSSSARSSKQLHATSQTEVQVSGSQQRTTSTPSAAMSNRLHQSTEATVSSPRHLSTTSSDKETTPSVAPSAADSSEEPTTSSLNSAARPSSLPLQYSGGRLPHSGKLVPLDLPKQYKKPRSLSQAENPPKETRRQPDWMRAADIMLEEVPAGQHWRDKIKKLDSSISDAVVISVAPVPRRGVSPTGDAERKELIRLVRRFAQRHSEGRVNFEQLVLVCLCNVLSSQGVTQGKIVETLQICISDTSERNIERYLKGAIWVNKLMNDLFLTDWSYRAVDLIAIWNRSVATYGKIGMTSNSRQYFITDLMQHKYFDGYQEVHDRKHDTIPWIVKRELGDEVSYRDVCEALGYSEDFFMMTEHLHSNTPSSPKVNAGDLEDTGFQPRRDSSPTISQAQTGTSNIHQLTSVDETPSNYPFSTTYLQDMSLLRRQLHQEDSPEEDVAGKDPPTSRSVAFQKTKRMIPDRSAKPLGDPDVARRRKKPDDILSSADLPSTSRRERALSAQSAKRPLPESPTSAFQPSNASRRRQQLEERSSSEETSPASHPEKNGSKGKGRP